MYRHNNSTRSICSGNFHQGQGIRYSTCIITAILFKMVDPVHYAGPMFHLCTGYTLLGAFFLATESSSSPVNFVPMIIYGCLGGFLIILIRNIGAYPDGTLLAILFINLMNPLIDKIRPKTLGGGVNNA